MIRKEPVPTVWWAFWALGIGIIGVPIAWALIYVNTRWEMPAGPDLKMNWSDALVCLRPSDVLNCREVFSYYGYESMRSITTYQFITFAPLLVGFGIFAFGIWQRWLRQKQRIILAGPTVADFPALRDEAYQEQPQGGLPMFNGWSISDLRSRNGIIVFGAPGSGKTNFLRYLLQSTADAKDRKIVFGYKPDMLEQMPKDIGPDGRATIDPILLNPADKRSWIWDVARDMTSVAECLNLARSLIQGEDQKFFQQSAQAVAAVILIKLHKEKPGKWTWRDLFEGFRLDKKEFADLAAIYHPDALSYIEVEERQWDGTRATLQTSLDNLQLLAIAWGDYNGRSLVSVKDFMQSDSVQRTLILGHSGRFSDLSKVWITVFMTVAAKSVFHENFRMQHGKRTWFVIDEFARLGKVDGIDELVTAGRERGASVVLGVQDFHAIEATYGPHAFKTWMSSIQTKVICRIEAGETASWLMKILGKTRIRELKTRPGPNGASVKEWSEYEDNAFRDNEMSKELFVIKNKGTWVLVVGYGGDHYRIFVPFMPFKTHNEAYVPAEWVEEARPIKDAAE